MEHDLGGHDGIEGDIDIPIPVQKGIAVRFPLSGKLYYGKYFLVWETSPYKCTRAHHDFSDLDNITVTYGQNLAPVDPFHSLFDYQVPIWLCSTYFPSLQKKVKFC